MCKSVLRNTALTAALFTTVSINAATIHLSGDTVDFYYDSAVHDVYGTLYTTGDYIYATPTNFSAESQDGVSTNPEISGPTDTLNGTGTIQVVAKDGYNFANVTVAEGGIYNISGNGSVDVDATLRVFALHDPMPVIGTEIHSNLSLSGPLNLIDGNNHNWSASTAEIDLSTSFWTDGPADINTYGIGLSLSNLLTAYSEDIGDYAYINKTFTGGGIGVTIETTVIPVPAAVWLFGSGLIALFGFVRKRK